MRQHMIIITLSLLLIIMNQRPTKAEFQLTGMEETILRSLLRFRGFRVKLFEYFHESLSLPILSFLIRDRRSIPRNIETLIELAKLTSRTLPKLWRSLASSSTLSSPSLLSSLLSSYSSSQTSSQSQLQLTKLINLLQTHTKKL